VIDRGGMRLGTQLLQRTGQVIDDETVGIPEHPGLHTGHFPPRQVAVEPVEECAVVADPGRERAEQVRCPERDLDIQVEVALEDHRGVGSDRLLAPRVGPRLHVVLEDLEGLRVTHPIKPGNLVESDHVPLADQPWFGLDRLMTPPVGKAPEAELGADHMDKGPNQPLVLEHRRQADRVTQKTENGRLG